MTTATKPTPDAPKAKSRSPAAATEPDGSAKARSWKSRVLAPIVGLPSRAAAPVMSSLRWSKQHRIKALIIAVGLTTALVVPVVLVLVLVHPAPPEPESDTLESAFAALDQGRYEAAREAVDHLAEAETISDDDKAAHAYIRGVTAAHEAASVLRDDRRKRQYLLAAGLLEEAHDRGFPADREADGLYLLGKCLELSGQHAAARPLLIDALEASSPHRQTEIHRLLAAAYSRDSEPDNAEALRHNTRYLSDASLSSTQRERGYLDRVEIQFRLGDVAGCRESLDHVPRDSELALDANVLRGRLLMHETRALEDDPNRPKTKPNQDAIAVMYDQAMQVFRQVQARDTTHTPAARRAMYLTGVCLERTGDLAGATEQFDRTQKAHFDFPEGLAALLAQADLLRRQNKDDEAVESYVRAATLAGNPQRYDNPWVSLEQFRTALLTAYVHYLNDKKFPLVLRLTARMSPLISRARTLQLSAEAHVRWADELTISAAAQPPAQADALRRQARAELRAAGRDYARLAALRIADKEYPKDLWLAAQNNLAGRDYASAVTYLTAYLKNQSNEGRPLAMVRLGEAQLALGNVPAAIRALDECIEQFPKDATAFRARYLAANAYMERGDVALSEKLLRDNLTGQLAPASPEWRDSLFALGRLQFTEATRLDADSRAFDLLGAEKQTDAVKRLNESHARCQKAIEALSEAVQRYPNDPQATQGRYMIAESYRTSTRLPRRKLKATTIENTRVALNQQITDALGAALAQYSELQNQLNRQQESAPLAAADAALLRNCYFAQGGAYFELGQYDLAIAAYKAAANRYQNHPETLNAFFQIAACYRSLNRPDEARSTLRQAKIALDRMKANDADVVAATSYSKKEWERLFAWMTGL